MINITIITIIIWTFSPVTTQSSRYWTESISSPQFALVIDWTDPLYPATACALSFPVSPWPSSTPRDLGSDRPPAGETLFHPFLHLPSPRCGVRPVCSGWWRPAEQQCARPLPLCKPHGSLSQGAARQGPEGAQLPTVGLPVGDSVSGWPPSGVVSPWRSLGPPPACPSPYHLQAPGRALRKTLKKSPSGVSVSQVVGYHHACKQSTERCRWWLPTFRDDYCRHSCDEEDTSWIREEEHFVESSRLT